MPAPSLPSLAGQQRQVDHAPAIGLRVAGLDAGRVEDGGRPGPGIGQRRRLDQVRRHAAGVRRRQQIVIAHLRQEGLVVRGSGP